MLAAWREGGDTRSVIEDVLGVDPGEFDAAFSAAVQAEFGDVLAGLDEWRRLQQGLAGALADEDWAAVEALADEMLALRPEDVSMTSPYLALATAQREQGRDARALATLEVFWRRGGYDPAALAELARGLHADGSTDRALDVFASIMLVDPLDEALHGEYGEMLLAAGRPAEALREFEIALAQSPHDMAAAWYRMAAASAALGRNEAAQGQLLEALTIAPNYRPAQKLLLEVSGADK
jgi:tetratricopeptide (TPR) repeat protein